MAQAKKSANRPTWTSYITLAVALVGMLAVLGTIIQGLQASSSDKLERPAAVATADTLLLTPQPGAPVPTPTPMPTIDPFFQQERYDTEASRVWHG